MLSSVKSQWVTPVWQLRKVVQQWLLLFGLLGQTGIAQPFGARENTQRKSSPTQMLANFAQMSAFYEKKWKIHNVQVNYREENQHCLNYLIIKLSNILGACKSMWHLLNWAVRTYIKPKRKSMSFKFWKWIKTNIASLHLCCCCRCSVICVVSPGARPS